MSWLLLVFFLLASPAWAVEDKEDLRARVEARWAALVAGDFDRAYEFETPAYRVIYTARQFRLRHGQAVRWKWARVLEIDARQPEVATVTVEIEYSFSSGNAMMEDKSVDTETWLKVDGRWWHRFQQTASPAESSKS